MNLFNSRTKSEGAGNSGGSEPRTTSDLGTTYNKLLRKLAGYFQGLSRCLSRKGQLITLLLFSLGGGSLSFYLVASSVTDRKSSLSLVQIAKPSLIDRSGDENTRSGITASEIEYLKIKRFRAYMDSLASTPSARKVYDSILHSRPGLMDSVIFLESMYQSQLKK